MSRFNDLSAKFLIVEASDPLPLDITAIHSSEEWESLSQENMKITMSSPVAVCGSGSLSTILFTTSEFEHQQECQDQKSTVIDGNGSQKPAMKVQASKDTYRVEKVTRCDSLGNKSSLDLSVDELRSPRPKTVVSAPHIDSSENIPHSSQCNVATVSVEEKKLKNTSSRGLKRPFAVISHDN